MSACGLQSINAYVDPYCLDKISLGYNTLNRFKDIFIRSLDT